MMALINDHKSMTMWEYYYSGPLETNLGSFLLPVIVSPTFLHSIESFKEHTYHYQVSHSNRSISQSLDVTSIHHIKNQIYTTTSSKIKGAANSSSGISAFSHKPY
jgi:hypothetical protein